MFSKFNAVYPQTQETPGSKIPGFLPKFREASALYLTHFLRTFSLSLPGIYVPIFIFGLAQKPAVLAGDFLNNIFWVLVYYFIYSIFVTLANIFLSNLLFQKLGFRVSILLSMLFLVLVVACLFELEENFSLIYLAPVLTALAVHFYWIPFHIFFIRKANFGGNFGNESASQVLTVTLAGAFGPLAAGLILSFFDFKILFLVTGFLLFLSAVPTLFLVTEAGHSEHRFKKIYTEYIFNPKLWKLNLAFIGAGIDGIIFDIFWPILLFLVLKNFVQLGGLVSFSMVLSALIMVWVGRILESRKAMFLRKASVFLNSALYFFRIVAVSPGSLFAIDVFDRLNGKVYGTAFLAESYDKAKLMHESDFIIYRETMTHLANILAMILAFAVILSFENWKLVFVLPALGSLLVFLLYI